MKRKRHLRASKRPMDLGVERDVATDVAAGAVRPPPKRYTNLKLPHERDESTARPAEPNPVTEQAADDIEAGKQETDCYNATGRRFDEKQTRD
jgi:hypothetical protein